MQLKLYKKRLELNYMGEKTIQSIPIMPFALMIAIISAVLGLVVGIFYAAIFGFITATLPTGTAVLNVGWLRVLFGLGSIITMPIMFFIAGLIQGVIVAVLYNFLAPRIGGIKLRFKEENYASPQP
jgi:hypothetical protein